MVPRWRPVELRSPEPLRFGRDPACLVLTSAEAFGAAFGVGSWFPRLDWSRELVLVVQRGECPSGGYAVAVTDLAVRGPRLKVTVTTADPTPADFVTMVVTYPQAAVAVERESLRGVSEVAFVNKDGKILGTVGVSV